jgi:hypothetical protein
LLPFQTHPFAAVVNPGPMENGRNRFVNQLTLTSRPIGHLHRDAAMHKIAVAFFSAFAGLSISVPALVFISKASAQHGEHVGAYECSRAGA